MARLRFLLTPRWIILQAVVIAFVLACYFVLAPWQFSRSQQHDTELAAVAAATSLPAVDGAELLSTTHQPSPELFWREVTATGHFLPEDESYIRLRQDTAGQPAYEVVVPFVTDSGTILVDRGYFPFRAVQEQTSRTPELPAGTVTITGRVHADQVDPKDRPPAETPDGRAAYIATSSAILTDLGAPAPAFRGYISLVADSPGVITEIPVPMADDARPFYSYAIQWLSFGAIAVIGLGYFIYREYRDPEGGSIYLDEVTAPFDTHEADAEDVDGLATRGPQRAAKFDKSALYDD